MFSRESDAEILAAAQRYIEVQKKIPELLTKAEDQLLSGSSGTVYLKKLGHRLLSAKDVENLINTLGTKDDQKALVDFNKAQLDLRDRLKSTKAIGLLLEQAEITRDLFYNRVKQPNLWKAEEIVKVMVILDRGVQL